MRWADQATDNGRNSRAVDGTAFENPPDDFGADGPGPLGAHQDVLAQIRKAGFVRVRIDQEIYDVEALPQLDPKKTHAIDAIVDRIVIKEESPSRISDAVRLACRFGEGLATAVYQVPEDQENNSHWHEELFSTQHACRSVTSAMKSSSRGRSVSTVPTVPVLTVMAWG